MTAIFLVLLTLGGFQAPAREEYRIFVPHAYLNIVNIEWAQRGVKQKLNSVEITQRTRHGVLSSVTADFKVTCSDQKDSAVTLLLSGFPDTPQEMKKSLEGRKLQFIAKAEDAQHVLLNSKEFRDALIAHVIRMLEGACGLAPQREHYFTVSFWAAINPKGDLTQVLYVTNPSTKELLDRLK